MSKIDVSKCKFHETDDSCVSVINKKCTVCSKIPTNDCYYKQLQKLKAVLNDIYDICSNSLSVKLLFKDRIDLAIFIRRRIKEVNNE